MVLGCDSISWQIGLRRVSSFGFLFFLRIDGISGPGLEGVPFEVRLEADLATAPFSGMIVAKVTLSFGMVNHLLYMEGRLTILAIAPGCPKKF